MQIQRLCLLCSGNLQDLLVTFALPGNADPEALPPLLWQLTGERSVGGAEVIKFSSLKSGFLAIAINSFM